MLKALELVGFKSFAERTRFEFPDGITVVVGPNGSGKSNIVDAIKWVLGTQSPKSLRGKEMTDVIFKGASGRKAAGAAEATIIFDNAEGLLPVDAPEVHLTRRVYRSGEGEYLLNGQPCRLKDVRNLVRGSGIGVDAYSLIEQGKVDRMLQANAKDRRTIFEEAAGISRFKAKKIEALRRMGRVEQNLLRLGDIVEEVAGRLTTLKSQASRAEWYRQKSEELKQLRFALAWTDWFEMESQVERLQTDADAAEQRKRAAEERLGHAREQCEEVDRIQQSLTEQMDRGREEASQRTRRIATLTGGLRTKTDRILHLEENVRAGRRRLLVLHAQSGSTTSQLHELAARCERLQHETAAARQQARDDKEQQDRIRGEVSQLRASIDEAQTQLLERSRTATQLEMQVERAEVQLGEFEEKQIQLQQKKESTAARKEEIEEELSTRRARREQLDDQIAQLEALAEERRRELEDRRRLLQRRKDEIAALRGRVTATGERIELLDALEQKREGVGSGVQGLLQRARATSSGPLTSIKGILAELIQTDVHVAPLVDLVLGDLTQAIVVSDGQIAEMAARGKLVMDGRITFLRLDDLAPGGRGDRIRLDGLGGVVGRIDRMLETEQAYQPLITSLLGATWLVDTLQTANRLGRLTRAGIRFVTRQGELLDIDGRLTVGGLGDSAGLGLVSRRSELQKAQQELKHFRFQLESLQKEAGRLHRRVDEREAELAEFQARLRKSVSDSSTLQADIAALETREKIVGEEVSQVDAQIAHCHESREALQQKVKEYRIRQTQLAEQTAAEDSQLAAKRSQLQSTQQSVATIDQQVLESSGLLARLEHRLETLQLSTEQLRRDHSERGRAVADVRENLAEQERRISRTAEEILAAETQLAEEHLYVQQLETAIEEAARELQIVRGDYRQAQAEATKLSEAARKCTSELDTARMGLEQLQARREDLIERLREDYSVDLTTDDPPADFEPIEDREATRQEIVELRRKLENVGSVNMQALQELDELQSRYDTLHEQYQDLTAAKDSLREIVHRIDQDSRRLFLETLEAIRVNFQTLYRRSFGGGNADLVLEDPDDPLESGVDIMATPPGKPEFSNSLLSGGEKALTAVALLMAIFQYRPSPFCILDEVDAPFDEANIGRFVTVLGEFLDQTKFVIVTHSKKTMTAATTLYGVTMQESGVSTRVAVKFEEVDDQGRILTPVEARRAA